MLDIIIPAYKDPEGLRRTLNSVYTNYDWITITVVDDHSPIEYDDIAKDFPGVIFHRLHENRGPGYARQYGMDHTHQPYILFVDCGDIILSKYLFLEIKDTLEKYSERYVFLFQWISQQKNVLSSREARSTQGWIYKREFFDRFSVHFCTHKLAGYADEDVGFNHTITTIIKDLEIKDDKVYSAFIEIPIYRKIFHGESITQTGRYNLTKQVPGLAINSILCIHQLEDAGVGIDCLVEELNILLFALYRDFLKCANQDVSLLQEHWEYIRQFYFETYQKYKSLSENNTYIMQNMRWYFKDLAELIPTPNIRRFLKELKEYEKCPDIYYTLIKN